MKPIPFVLVYFFRGKQKIPKSGRLEVFDQMGCRSSLSVVYRKVLGLVKIYYPHNKERYGGGHRQYPILVVTN